MGTSLVEGWETRQTDVAAGGMATICSFCQGAALSSETAQNNCKVKMECRRGSAALLREDMFSSLFSKVRGFQAALHTRGREHSGVSRAHPSARRPSPGGLYNVTLSGWDLQGGLLTPLPYKWPPQDQRTFKFNRGFLNKPCENKD